MNKLRTNLLLAACFACFSVVYANVPTIPIIHGKAFHHSVHTTIPININTVDAKTLASHVKGIGKKRAEAIIAHREKYGQFETLEALEQVVVNGRRLGKNFVERVSGQLRLK